MPAYIRFLTIALCLSFALAHGSAHADEASAGTATGLPLPRFASLHADKINMRTGPGTRYPIEWVYVREGLPVEITAEFDIWRRVRDWEGSEGWVHKSGLTGRRTLIVTGGQQSIYDDTDENAAVNARVESGAIGQILGCERTWCKVRFNDINGFMPKTAFWGAYSNETFN